ncbi:MAG TPA: hypothetical protein VGO52_21740 [Hyphomonadaceae bacterium]|nr:hypothetical protein [Hyphomonadaceae bacterium]
MSEKMKGLWRLAAVVTPALALVACDSGYKAGYYEGFSLGYETKGSEKTEKQQAAAEPSDAVPLSLATPAPAPAQVAAIAPPKTQAAKPARAPQKAPVGQAKPAARATAQRAPAPTPPQPAAAEPAPVETAAVETPPAAQPSPGARPQPAIAPFAPLRPGPSGGGVIIRVGNNTATPNDDDKPDTGPDDGVKPGDGNPGDGVKPSDGNSGGSDGKDPYKPPVVAPQLPGTQVAKITVVDTNLVGVSGNSQLIGVGVGSSSPAQAQLASVNVLPVNGRSLGAVDSLVSVSVGKTPIVSGGTAPLVSVNALPDLSGVTAVVSPITGALVGSTGSGGTTATASSGGGASTSTAAIPVVPVVTTVVTNVGNVATGLVGGLLGGGSSRGKH